MADHAKKGRPRKPANGKGKGAKAKQAPAQNKPRLLLMLVAILVLCAAFGYFLLHIEGSADNVENQPTQQPSVKAAKPLPKAPTESWDYENLDQKEISIDLPQQQQSTISYRLQCGSFKSIGQAESMKATIAFQGFESFIKKVTGKNRPWYQVYLGPFPRKRGAEAARHKLQRAGLNYCEIFHWQG